MEPVAAMRQKSKGRPGKSTRPTSRFKAQGLAPKRHQNDLPKAKPSDVYFAAGGFYADHFGASSVASALGIRHGRDPAADDVQLNMPSQMLGQNRTFLLCWE